MSKRKYSLPDRQAKFNWLVGKLMNMANDGRDDLLYVLHTNRGWSYGELGELLDEAGMPLSKTRIGQIINYHRKGGEHETQ